ncbi:TonB-dependent receptor [Hydrogenophaga pseudoflava]|uniref:Putative TonB-dependent receptor BfrD n=1 Tax=Hydrogenophaga pseudoflava TaxID=47421 RepID=A0A4P6WZX7_HYDPS|nr:TonB-dependent siderophore receptor [Hydrogenophaga pseudoflava]QBM27985.1 putative TonB-dependent receptor BfrD precursor [Hydrogenophaga pseudoflava]
MSQRRKNLRARAGRPLPAPSANLPAASGVMLPLGAMLLASSFGALAQTAPASEDKQLPTVVVREKALAPEGKDALQATETTIGKGKQQLRDIPQSVTVVTERLIDDRNLDTVKEALKNTAGITFLAAEGGEEDIRLRGFALQATGDLFIDGMRDPAIYDRDTFAMDRMEVLRGSASMLFGRGSTGGAVNQVSKVPRLIDEHQVDLTLGNHKYVRATGDFNIMTGDSSALRLNAMATKADNNGSGASLDKRGMAVAYRTGIGERDEFLANLYHLDNNNGVNYGMPFIAPARGSSDRTLLPVDPDTNYGLASDYNDSSATIAGLAHTHRFSRDSELKTQVRVGKFDRDLRSGAIRLCTQGVNQQTGAITNPNCPTSVSLDNFGPGTVLTRGTHLKIQKLDSVQAQSDFSTKFDALGVKHELIAGVDVSREERTVYAARSAAQGGVNITKPTTTIGTPEDGASVNEASRVLRVNNAYVATGVGAYVQDVIQVAPAWKVVGGVRYDNLNGDYDINAIPDAAPGPVTATKYRMHVSEFSPRIGALFQPTPLHSFHVSAGSSFNTSGDAYSLSASNADTDPEKSVNLELGAKLDSADKRFSTRLAVFRSTKTNERNTDPDLPVTVLSGKRHVAGFEADVTGRLTPQWEVYGSYMWLPVARVDQAAPCPATGACAQSAIGERPGDRPSLTPEHSGTVWSTYQFTPRLRLGAGLNFRSAQSPTRVAFKVPSYTTVDLMAEYTFDFDRLSIKAYLANATDKLYADQLYPAHYIPGAGRTLQVTASLKF